MEGWKDLSVEIRSIAEANGFDKPTLDNLIGKVMMVVTEVDEGLRCTQGIHDGTLAEELADVGIRLVDILTAIWEDGWSTRLLDWRKPLPERTFEPFERLAWPIVSRCCDAVEAWLRGKNDDARICLEYALAETNLLASTLKIDLHAEMEKKCARNRTRSRLHGKVRSEG